MKGLRIFILIIFGALCFYLSNEEVYAENTSKDYIIYFNDKDIPKTKHNKELMSKLMNGYTSKIEKYNLEIVKQFKYLPFIIVKGTEQEMELIKENERDIISIKENLETSSGITSSYGDTTEISSIDERINQDYLNETKISDLHKQGYYGKGIRIGIIDSGTAPHNDYKITGGKSFVEGEDSNDYKVDKFGHGTNIAGIIGGIHNNDGTENGNIVDGVAPSAEIYSLKISNDTYFKESAILDAIEWAINNNIDVINISYGYENPAGLGYVIFSHVEYALDVAYQYGILISGAAGNEGSDKEERNNVVYPSKFYSVIAVSGYDKEGKLSETSSIGTEIEVSAPGKGIFTTSSTTPTKFDIVSGTSFASPIVAGTLALLKEKYPEYSNIEIRELLSFLSQTNYQTGYNDRMDYNLVLHRNNFYGYGKLRAEVGEKSTGTIKITDKNVVTSMCLFPKERFCKPDRVELGKEYKVVRTFEDDENNLWFEIEASINNVKTLRWFRILTEDFNENITLNSQTSIVEKISDTNPEGSLSPQTVTSFRKVVGVDWYLVNTWKGKRWINPSNFNIGNFKLNLTVRESLYTKKADGTYAGTGSNLAPQTVNVMFREGDWFKINTWEGERWIKPKSYFIGEFTLTSPTKVKVYNNKNDMNSYLGEFNMGSHKIIKRDNEWFQREDGLWINPSKYFLGVFQIKLLESKKIYKLTQYNTFEYVGSLSPQTVYAYSGEAIRYSSNSPYFPTYTINSWLGKVLIVGDEPDVEAVKGIELVEYDDNLLK